MEYIQPQVQILYIGYEPYLLHLEEQLWSLSGSKIIDVDNNLREDRALFEGDGEEKQPRGTGFEANFCLKGDGAQKLVGILIGVGQASACVASRMHGSVSQLGVGDAILIITQLCFATFIVMCLDELLQNGYGLGSGISLFLAANFCENIMWNAFSPTTINNGRGFEFEGALVALVHMLLTKTDKVQALREAFYRQNLPNFTNLLATTLIFLIVIYFQGFHVVLPVKSKSARGHQGNFIVNLIGKWDQTEYGGGHHSIPVGGLTYYITAPSNLANMAADPFRPLFYVVFLLSLCAIFSKSWILVSGSSARDFAKHLMEQQMMMPGHQEATLETELNRYIPAVAAFGGVCIGALTVLADFTGAIGSGAGILLTVTTIYHCYEIFEKERASQLPLFGF